MQPADEVRYEQTNEVREGRKTWLGRLLAVVSLTFSLCIVASVLWYCRYGFDFTDEGLYLNWISHPFNYRESTSQFGFAYHPLYLLVGGSVSALRQANLIATYSFAWLAAWVLLGKIFEKEATSAIDRVAIAAAIATTSILSQVFNSLWLPTPSYNTLAFQGLLLAATGFFLADESTRPSSILGWVLIGVGGWLTFMGKPTSAAVLALLTATYLILSGKIRVTQLAIALGTALSLLALTAILIDGSIQGFVDRNKGGLLLANMLVGDYAFEKLLRLEDMVWGEKVLQVMSMLGGGVFLGIWLTRLKFATAGILAAAIVAVSAVLAAFRFIPLPEIPSEQRALLLFAIPAGTALAGLSMLRLKDIGYTYWTQLVLCLTILLFPYAYAFGTGNNYWVPIGSAGAFVVLASLAILKPLARQTAGSSMLLVAGLALQTLAVILISSAFSTPYRQPQPLSKNDTALEIGGAGSKLILAKAHADYLSSVLESAKRAGFQQGMPMIDLSGHSPGVLYVLGANSPGVAWTLGGYPGTARFVTRGLQWVSCEQLTTAWLLSESKGPRSVPGEVLASFGANLEKDYKTVGEIQSPDGQIQYLSKPTRDTHEAIQACEAAKASTA